MTEITESCTGLEGLGLALTVQNFDGDNENEPGCKKCDDGGQIRFVNQNCYARQNTDHQVQAEKEPAERLFHG